MQILDLLACGASPAGLWGYRYSWLDWLARPRRLASPVGVAVLLLVVVALFLRRAYDWVVAVAAGLGRATGLV